MGHLDINLISLNYAYCDSLMITFIKRLSYLWLLSPVIIYADISIPSSIKPPQGNNPLITLHAKGDQIYQCTLAGGQYSWQLQAPNARLYDNHNQIVGNHYSGPVWEYKEGSRVVGKVLNKIDVAPESSISWLLVEVVSHKGNGFFSGVSFINRVNTAGGLFPKVICDSNHLGGEKRIPYTADYIFYTKAK